MDNRTFDSELNRILTEAEEILSALPGSEPPDIYGWYRHEYTLWGLGEEIRQVSLKSRRPFSASQASRILDICLNRQAGRGRQSFILLLGKRRYSGFAVSIVTLLHDRDVEGHVINTLSKMMALDYAEQIRPFLTSKQTWIRNEAKHYFQKLDSSP